MPHKPVLLKEALDYLALKPGDTVVDGTLGSAGHAQAILEKIGPNGRLIGLDQDPESIKRCREFLKNDPRVLIHQENFKNLDRILDFLHISFVNAVILDVGLSSNQLEDAGRGFSFERSGPLDMRMNPELEVSAQDLINDLSQNDLERIFLDYGNERWARRFAQVICEKRQVKPVERTEELVEILINALPRGLRAEKGHRPAHARRHPATKVFQALRIVVNQELEALQTGLPVIWKRLADQGRLVVITFHSLEDRIVKNYFRDWYRNKEAIRLTKKPVAPGLEECKENPRARSAKLRAIEKGRRNEGIR